jgi:hypothetical protein
MPVMGGSGELIASTISSGILPGAFVSKYLENSGSNDMGIDGSGTAVSFTYTPPAGKDLLGARILIYLESGANFGSTNFMHLAALSNGVKISAAGVPLTNWKDNIDIICDMFDLSNAGIAFSNERRSLAGRWTFTRGASGEPLTIFNGETFEVLIRDDLSAAGIIFRIKLQGKLVDA